MNADIHFLIKTLTLAFNLTGKKLYGAVGIGVLFLLVIFLVLLTRKKTSPYIRKLLSISFPSTWRTILLEQFPLYSKLPAKTRDNLNKHIQVFLGTKDFEGASDLEVTEEIRLIIAAQACLLICNIDPDYSCYQHVSRVVVHPRQFQKTDTGEELTDGVAVAPFLDENGVVPGEIHLSWSEVQTGIADGKDGYNPVFHYFARALDQEDMEEDGVPSNLIGDKVSWIHVWHSYFQKFQMQVRAGETTTLDQSASRSLPEFFAVATEVFFESPQKLLRESPGLYNKLRFFYRQDPSQY
ncbi:zinc-dependent peptidase [Myxococcota bacterium]|nr:zinc-dependent peptidase [Myxococcota bacterium]